jgi:pimeloyl-ACP methyl ester carboxylesterase
MPVMSELSQTVRIATGQGSFTADVAGPSDAPLVVLLHGFPQSRHSWRAQLPALAQAGWRAVAPDQRGYSPGVRPDPTLLDAYAIDRLVTDVLELADACPPAGRAFHLVGHDWGGQVAWCIAARHPERVASLSVLSRPHPAAFRRSYQDNRDGQHERSRHHRRFNDPATGALLLEDGARRLRRSFSEQRVPAAAIELYLSVIGSSAALEAALAWYRAAGTLAAIEVGAIEVPTLYVWGDADATVGSAAAESTGEFVKASYRFERLAGVGHFISDEAPDAVNRLLLEQLSAASSRRG